MPITTNQALILVLSLIGFYVLLAWGILYIISKRSKRPNKRRAQFLFALTVVLLIITYFNGSLGLWSAAIAIPMFAFCARYMKKQG